MNKFFTLAVLLTSWTGLGGTIQIAGSDTMLPLNKAWVAEYQRIAPSTTVKVSGGGSQLGVRALLEGKTDIAASSRPLSGAEKAEFRAGAGKDLMEVTVALDVIGVYVHDSNPVPQLSLEQLREIFSGRIRNWSKVGGRNQPIYVYIRDTNSGTHQFFKEHVLRGEAYSPRAREVATTEQLTDAVSYNANAIGFGGYAYAKAARRLRVATDEAPFGHHFNPDEAGSNEYPLSRVLYFYIHPRSDSASLRQFVQWVLDDEGQSIVDGVGYFALDKSDRAKQLVKLGWQPIATDAVPAPAR